MTDAPNDFNDAMLTVDAVNSLLRSVIMQALSLPADYVLVENRTRPRPPDKTAYVTLYWVAQELLPQHSSEFTAPLDSGEGEEYFSNEAHCTVRITVRGPDAYNLCSKLRYAFEASERQWDLYKYIGFAGITSLTDLSALFGGQIQPRAFFEFSFYACFGKTYPLGWFNRSPFAVNDQPETTYPLEYPPCPK